MECYSGTKIKNAVLVILLVLVCPLFALCQVEYKDPVSIQGVVTDEHGVGLDDVHVYIDSLVFGQQTDHRGEFHLQVPKGKYLLNANKVGYKRYQQAIELEATANPINIVLSKADYTTLDEATVVGKSALQEVRETAYNVTALDAKRFHNTTLDLAHLLNRASGVKIRENGGLGSDVSINLNGFTGRHIKVFIDGVPMDGMGSAFQLNNIPVNLADRIEIYKGVVPIELGADALGGAINIVTNNRNKSYAEASYSFGSFNTHKTNVNLGYTADNGFTVQLNAFQNYSDNNYRVYTRIRDFETSTFTTDSVWVRRFHDNYHNETLVAKTGFLNTPWADQLLLGITLGQEYVEIQNSNLMEIVFGARSRSGNTVMPSLTYSKKDLFVDKLNVRYTANYNRNLNHNVDTSRYQYNWYGEKMLNNGGAIGESLNTLAKFYNNNANSTLNLSYEFLERHSLALNDVFSTYERKNADKSAVIDEDTNEDTRSSNYKNVLGLSYKYNLDDKWVTTVFGKHFVQSVTGSMDVSTNPSVTRFERQTRKSNSYGYGLATTYFLHDFQLKASVEQALRMPNERELFGDEVLETGNATLKPENSKNVNLGFTFQKDFSKDHSLFIDASGMYRKVSDFIRREINPRFGTAMSSNHGLVQNWGLNVEGRYYYKRSMAVGGTFTYQDIRDKEDFLSKHSTQPNVHKNDRMPNMPYLFGNGEVEVFLHDLMGKHNMMNISYNLSYVHDFFLRWESLGSSGGKDVVGKQLSHDLIATYSLKGGKYNIAVEARNITDERLYDNYSLQKPGRSFAVKLRYFFVKQNKF